MSHPDNEQYWIDRHKKLRGQLASVGHVARSQSENEELYVRKRQMLSDLMVAMGVPSLNGKTVLDAGCGVGMVSDLLAERGAQVVGLDASPDALEQARLRCPSGRFAEGSIVDFSLSEKFDMIFCIDVLYHVIDDRNWKTVLSNFVKHLRQGPLPRYIVLVDQHKAEVTKPAPHVHFRTAAMYDQAFNEIAAVSQSHIIRLTPAAFDRFALVYLAV